MKLSASRLFAPVLCISAFGGAVLPSVAVAADNWDVGFQPHLEIGVADYTLDFSATAQLVPTGAISTSKLSLSETMPTISAGLTVFADRFFLDLAVQRMQSYNQTLSDKLTIIASSPDSLQTSQGRQSTDDFTRDEYTLSLGYGFSDTISVYIGYKKQYTDMQELIGTGPLEIQNAGTPTPAPIYGTFDTFADIKFDYDGPFAGATTGWKFDNGTLKGRLSVSAAIALMQGSLKAESPSASLTLGGIQIPITEVTLANILNTDGDAVGITLGTAWLGQTNIAGLSYSVALNGYNYDFSSDINGRPEVNESVLQLKLGLAYAF